MGNARQHPETYRRATELYGTANYFVANIGNDTYATVYICGYFDEERRAKQYKEADFCRHIDPRLPTVVWQQTGNVFSRDFFVDLTGYALDDGAVVPLLEVSGCLDVGKGGATKAVVDEIYLSEAG